MPGAGAFPARNFQQAEAVSRLLFHWRASDLNLITVGRASTGVFTRASAGGIVPTWNGRLTAPAAPGLPRFEHVTVDTERDTVSLRLDGAHSNLSTKDDIMQWTRVSVPRRSSGVTAPNGLPHAYWLYDDGGASVEYIHNPVTFTGDGLKAVNFVIRSSSTPPAGGQRLAVVATTVPTTALSATITAWVDGEPTITMDTGTEVGREELVDDWWLLKFQTVAVTAASSHRFEIYPAVVLAETGQLDIYRVNAFDTEVAPSGIFSEAGSQAPEVVYWPYEPEPAETTLYVKMKEGGTVSVSSGRVLQIGSSVVATDPRLFISAAGGLYRASHFTNSTNTTATSTVAPSVDDTVELRLTLHSSGAVTLGQSINAAAETTQTSTGTATLEDAWAGEQLYLNSGGSTRQGLNSYICLKAAAGDKTMNYMRNSY